jgi:hypothetical protein
MAFSYFFSRKMMLIAVSLDPVSGDPKFNSRPQFWSFGL